MGSYILTTNREREMRATILLSLASLVLGAPQGSELQEIFDTFPSDFTDPIDVDDKVEVENDNTFDSCEEYTEEYGYECVLVWVPGEPVVSPLVCRPRVHGEEAGLAHIHVD